MKDLFGILILCALLTLIVGFLAAFAQAATPSELPRWEPGKPQQIERTLFP